jgi:lipopolysaccharide export system protein LptA
MHGDSIKIYTFNLNTDSVYRKIHCFQHVRAYRNDVQAVCDSMVYSSKDSCMTMYQDPIVWSEGRQLLGDEIRVYLNDSTIRMAHIIGQALSIEKVDDEEHFNQISSKEMTAFFEDGNIRRAISSGNVRAIYYPIDEKDTSIIVMDYTETDTMKMYFSTERKLEKIWMPKAEGTWYPLTQIPSGKEKLEQFAWLEELRPINKDDVFNWRGRRKENE